MMDINVKKLLASVVIVCSSVRVLPAQALNANYPVIGMPMPKFCLDNVHYYNGKTFSNRDLGGKWTIMDFWTKHCATCIAYFTKVNRLQKEFKDSIQFLLIGNSDKKRNKNAQEIYERYREASNLELSVAYDSAIFKQFGIYGVPHIIVIDPQTRVYAVTYGSFLTSENLQSLIERKSPSFERKYSEYDTAPAGASGHPWEYLVDERIRKSNLLYRSIITKNNGEPNAGYYDIAYTVADGMYQHVGFSLSQLYMVAFLGQTGWNHRAAEYGEYWPYPIIEVADSSPFEADYQQHTGLYNYSIIVPIDKSSKKYLMAAMQQDLRTCFGYDVSWETRLVPYWRLTVTDEGRRKLITKSTNTEDYRDPSGITAKRIPIGLVLSQIEEYNTSRSTYLPFIDETNIQEPIDIQYHAALANLDDVARELMKLGLILEKSEKEMRVLVIRDPR